MGVDVSVRLRKRESARPPSWIMADLSAEDPGHKRDRHLQHLHAKGEVTKVPQHPPLTSRESSISASVAGDAPAQPTLITTNLENNRILLDRGVLNNVRVLRR